MSSMHGEVEHVVSGMYRAVEVRRHTVGAILVTAYSCTMFTVVTGIRTHTRSLSLSLSLYATRPI